VADTLEELHKSLEDILLRLEKFNIKIKGKKCEIGAQSLEFLGMQISGEGIAIKDTRVEVINKWEFPVNLKQMAQFTGYVGFVTKFIPNAATLMAPFNDLKLGHKGGRGTQAKVKVIKTPELEKQFEKVKQAVREAKHLKFPNYAQNFYLKTDASKVGVGGYLYQLEDDGITERPIAYFSMKLHGTQLQWSINEKEAFGVFSSIMKFGEYLRGRPFMLLTDHANLQYIKHNSAPKVVRWFLRLQEFQFKISHIPREKNVISDCLAGAADGSDIQCGNNEVVENPESEKTKSQLPEQSGTDEDENENEDEEDAEEKNPEDPEIKNPILKPEIRKAIQRAHGTLYGHMQASKTYNKVKMLEPGSGVTMDHVKQFIKECMVCQKTAPSGKHVGKGRKVNLSCSKPWKSVAMDYFHVGDPDDEDNENAILVFIDQCTRKVVLYPVKGETAANCVDSLIHLYANHGPIEELKSDNAQHFRANIVKEFNRLTNTKHIKSVPNRSQSNGIVERANKEIKRHLQALVLDLDIRDGEWKRIVPLVQKIINNTISSVTGFTPEAMISGRDNDILATILAPIEHEDGQEVVDLSLEMKLLHDAQNEILQRSLDYQAGRREPDEDESKTTRFPTGAKVLALYPHNKVPKKHLARWQGPFTVLSQSGSVVQVKHLASGKTSSRHVSAIKLVQGDNKDTASLTKWAAKDDGEFVVEEIQKHSGPISQLRKCQFLIKWEGYPQDQASWEPFQNIKECEALNAYIASRKAARKPRGTPKPTVVKEVNIESEDKQSQPEETKELDETPTEMITQLTETTSVETGKERYNLRSGV
jgi:transposase InsO family protein